MKESFTKCVLAMAENTDFISRAEIVYLSAFVSVVHVRHVIHQCIHVIKVKSFNFRLNPFVNSLEKTELVLHRPCTMFYYDVFPLLLEHRNA